jgi:hypothetical protein
MSTCPCHRPWGRRMHRRPRHRRCYTYLPTWGWMKERGHDHRDPCMPRRPARLAHQHVEDGDDEGAQRRVPTAPCAPRRPPQLPTPSGSQLQGCPVQVAIDDVDEETWRPQSVSSYSRIVGKRCCGSARGRVLPRTWSVHVWRRHAPCSPRLPCHCCAPRLLHHHSSVHS